MSKQYSQAFFKQFFEAVQQSFAGGENRVDEELLGWMAEQGADVSRFFAEMMDIGLKSMSACLEEKPNEAEFEKLGEQAAQQYRAFYDTVLGKYLRMPQIGLGGESLRRMLLALDAHHKLMASLAEFIQEFNLPFLASLKTFQENFDEKKDRLEGAKDLYDAFLEIVNEKYKTYLGSPSGVRRVAELIDRHLTFKQSLERAVEPLLKSHNIPTRRDMDDVHLRLHTLRKKNRKLEAAVRKQDSVIDELRKDLQALQGRRVNS